MQNIGQEEGISLDFEEDLERVLQTILPDRYPFVCKKTDQLLRKLLGGEDIEEKKEGKKGRKWRKEKEINVKKVEEEGGEGICELVTGDLIRDILLPAMVNVGFLKISN